jgi:hypothetical protein
VREQYIWILIAVSEKSEYGCQCISGIWMWQDTSWIGRGALNLKIYNDVVPLVRMEAVTVQEKDFSDPALD